MVEFPPRPDTECRQAGFATSGFDGCRNVCPKTRRHVDLVYSVVIPVGFAEKHAMLARVSACDPLGQAGHPAGMAAASSQGPRAALNSEVSLCARPALSREERMQRSTERIL